MNKPTKRYEQTDLGVRVIYQNGATSVAHENPGQNPVSEAAVISSRLYALINLLTGEPGAEAFEALFPHDQRAIFDVIHTLAAETAALSQMARDIDIDRSMAASVVMEVTNG